MYSYWDGSGYWYLRQVTGYYWEYVLDAEGNSPTVSGDGANLSGGAKNDTISNYANAVTIDGKEGDDYLTSSGGANVNINGGDGNDSIESSSAVEWNEKTQQNDYHKPDNSVLDGGAGDDHIVNGHYFGNGNYDVGGDNVTINGGAGDDHITSYGDNAKIDGGEGNDHIHSYGDNAKIDDVKGDNYVHSIGDSLLINSGNGADYISSGGDSAIINSGSGNDTIDNGSFNAQINTGTGNDFVINYTKATINTGAGNDVDYIFNIGGKALIITGAGDDTINNGGESPSRYWSSMAGNNVTIDSGIGNDSIYSYGSNDTSINAGAGNDSITNVRGFVYKRDENNNTIRDENDNPIEIWYGDNVTIDGGEGDDYIQNEDNNSYLNGEAGNDTIYSLGDSVTIDSGTGNDSIYVDNGSSNVSVLSGANNDIIINYSSPNSTIDAGAGNDSIYNYAYNIEGYLCDGGVTIDGGDNDDYIENQGYYDDMYSGENYKPEIIINGGTGNDTILNKARWDSYYYYDDVDSYPNINVTIDGGADNDSIENGLYFVSINAGTDEGCDTVSNSGYGVTILTGAGKDSIANSGSTVTIDAGIGNNTINNGILEGHHETEGTGADATINFVVDRQYSGGSSVTIAADKDNDYIFNNGCEISINAGDGNNSISNGRFEGHMLNFRVDGVISQALFIDETVSGGNNITIKAGENDDTINNFTGSNISIDAGNGNNKISLIGGGENITVKGGTSGDSIYLSNTPQQNTPVSKDSKYDSSYYGSGVSINAVGGKNLVSVASTWSNVTVEGGDTADGVDVILNDGENVLLRGNAGNDYIKNTSDGAIIFGGDHGDIIDNYGNKVFIEGDNVKGAGSSNIGDYIFTDKGNDVTIDGGAASDTITALHDVRGSIYGGAGNDQIILQRLSAEDINKLTVGVLNPVLQLTSLKTNVPIPTNLVDTMLALGVLAAGATPLGWALSITSVAKSIYDNIKDFTNFKAYLGDLSSTSTVSGGAGDDTIISDGVAPRIFEYSNGEGNDEIYKFTVENPLKSALNLMTNDNFMSTLDVKSGRITDIAVIGNDVTFVVGSGSVKLVDGANKKFKLIEDEEKGSILTRAYGINDKTGEVICYIFGSEAEDDLQDNVGIKRDKNFTAYINSEPGATKDTIVGKTFSNVIYGYDGSDNLRGNDKNDTIYGGAGNDFIFGNGGNDLLYGDAGTDEIYGGDGKDTIHSYEGDTVDGGADDDYIKNNGSNVSIVGGTGNDKIVNHKSSEVTIDGGDDNDTIEVYGNNITVEGGTGNDSIRLGSTSTSNYTFGIKVNAGADKDTIKSYISYATIAGEAGDDLISLSSAAQKNFIEYKDGDGHDEIYGLTDDDTLKISSGNVSAVTVEDSDVILKIGEGSLRFKKFKGKEFKVTNPKGEIFKYKLSADKKTKEVTGSIIGGKGQATIYGTSGKDNLYGDIKSDLIYGNGGNDYIYDNKGSNTIYGGTGNDQIYANGKNNLIVYHFGDGNDTVSGCGTIRILGANYSTLKSGNDLILAVGDYSGLKSATQMLNGTIKLIGGEKYFKIEGTCNGQFFPEGLSKNGAGLKVSAEFKDKTIDLTDFDNIKNVDASSATKKLAINGNKSNNKIVGGQNADTLSGGKGDDKLTGGKGKDLFVYTSGKDTITDYATGDKISIGAGISKTKTSGNNVVFTVGKGSLTVQKAKGKTLSLIDSAGKEYSTVVGGTTLTLTNDKESVVKVNSSVEVIDASERKTAVEITGNAKANIISGGSKNDTIYGGAANDSILGNAGNDKLYGNAGKDTLVGGKGNDSLWGDAGADTFIYAQGDGKDIIYGFDNKDTLTLDGLDFKTSYSKKNNAVSFKFDDGSVTLKEFSATTFHVNNSIYKITNGKFKAC